MKKNTISFGNTLQKKKELVLKTPSQLSSQLQRQFISYVKPVIKDARSIQTKKLKKNIFYIKNLRNVVINSLKHIKIKSKPFKKWILQFLKKRWKYLQKISFQKTTEELIKIRNKKKKKRINQQFINEIHNLVVIQPSIDLIEETLIYFEKNTQLLPLKLIKNYSKLKKLRSRLFFKLPNYIVFSVSDENKDFLNRWRRGRTDFRRTFVRKYYAKLNNKDIEKYNKEKNKIKLEKKKDWFEKNLWNWLNRQKRLKLSKHVKILKTAHRKNGLPFILRWIFTSFQQNFLKTSVGQYFLTAHLQKHNLNKLNNSLYSQQRFNELYQNCLLGYNRSWKNRWFLLNAPFQELQQRHKLGWYYNNITWQKLLPNRYFDERFPYNMFLTYWRQHKLRPWLNYLQSKRRLYSALFPLRRREHYWIKKYFLIPYLQKKKPFHQKKNKLYQTHNYLLYPFRNRGLRKKEKFKHIKNILSKIILPFYGNLTQKQFKNLRKRTQRKKPETISRDNMHLGQFERRLDVTVYRLNLAPTIFWARKLIEDGAIFVSSTSDSTLWKTLYGSFKKYLFPLKLRDPKHLYRNSKSNPLVSIKMVSTTANHPKFLLEPVIKSQYLVKPGEIIYCAPGTFLNQFKTNSVLWKKPTPNHFLTFSDITETELNINSINQKYSHIYSSNIFENKLTVFATLLSGPTFTNLNPTDRISQSFIRWIYL